MPKLSKSLKVSPHGFCMDTSETWNVYTGHANRKPWVREGAESNTRNPEWESPLKLQSLSRREQSTVTCKTLSETAIHGMKYMDISENCLTIHMEVELLSTLKIGKTILMTPNVLEICFQQTATFQK